MRSTDDFHRHLHDSEAALLATADGDDGESCLGEPERAALSDATRGAHHNLRGVGLDGRKDGRHVQAPICAL